MWKGKRRTEKVSWEDYKRSRMSGMQRQGIMMLDMLTRSFDASVEVLEERLGGYKYARRDMGAVRAAIKRLREAALEGVEEDVRRTILRQSRDFRLGLERMSPIDRKQEMIVSMEDLWQMVNLAVEERCSMCMKTDAEARACPVRKLLRRYTNEPEPGLSSCGYMGSAMSGEVKHLNAQEGEL